MTFVPGGAGSMGAGFGAGGTTMTWWYDRPGIGADARAGFALAAAGTVAATLIIGTPSSLFRAGAARFAAKSAAKRKSIRDFAKRRYQDLGKMIQGGKHWRRMRLGKKGAEIVGPVITGEDMWFDQATFTGSIVEENMWLGPGVIFYVP